MCGINGFNFKDEALINKMVRATRHRGPDDSGVFCDENISLGHNRLAIIDLSPAGHQPMLSRDKRYAIVFNGELYNFQEIRKDLEKKGRKFVSRSDTEVILAAFIEYGPECLQKFNGIFAFAIWDKAKQELFAARDQFGVKPFFYFWDNQRFIFSSEIKGILEHKIEKNINQNALNCYFCLLYTLGPDTIWQNISKLLPGHYLVLNKTGLNLKKYWSIQLGQAISDREEAKARIKELLRASVKRQMIADVEVGMFLSGGLDSTIVLGLMKELTEKKIKTFSVGFAVSADQDEKFNQDAILAKRTSAFYGTEHHEIYLNEQDMIANLENMVSAMDELVYSPTQVANLLLARLAKQKVKVVLGGDGGDELFGGYTRYYYYNLIEKWRRLPRIFRNNIGMKNLFALARKSDMYGRLNMDDFSAFWSFMAQKEDLLTRIIRPEINDLAGAQNYVKNKSGLETFGPGLPLSEKMMQADMRTWLVEYSLARTDKITMAAGLEERVPILDIDLAQMAVNIPTKYKINSRNQGKLILKEAMREYIPDFIYNKQKTGWFVPMAKWLRAGLKDTAYDILSDSYNQGRTSQYLDLAEARKILDDHVSGRKYALNTIWSVINFQVWFRRFY
ncbi:MAG: Asparagine synthetase [Candidatus Falkowbacteria bacterium GW2011_GWC2_38_22]|uniref:asparagine synthase (glutamine-hydrolyzing) n=1 Tax=Candidatus Falkowbacteria bacterium GW2011_GWE1_38_31 TaxID=1618638 RepID=A0A0G0N2A6_9BACT|nr:MAG: Asparagine synthetase [Candidatus Falkowbacteria bacterium GW2011_GWF2_38_1205]KKQ61832.1 MAG: Asparagine synthetase [Candidatus Falkowbacteria bacterium GW2011_GWC2_38_22]KKQ64140.1 MAG: Asparagine synthetase [Candidatus Falkowbacteria bacterium GW2011_GWF1_38_22]KKQ66510.1 MAG: Asparagine synthetase [Candidatus Falkowbacteria bacterium GW2011_GWE2_38_254]KKQ71246.1 MAG: Asparagine synthetase [Candidatus Falkowbacteria bacterium GW2011_GWE1_38_31]KKQ73374.1 MAG: Asparagine synthetase 